MLKYVTLLGSATLALSLSTSAFGQEAVTSDTVVAKVGDTEITVGEIIVARRQLPAQYAQFSNDLLFEGLIDQLIQQQILADAAEDLPPRIEATLKNERRTMMATTTIDAITAVVVTEEALQEAYEAAFVDAEEVTEFHAAHLLVETEEEAQAAKARIDEGAVFGDVARDVSTGPTGPNGGDLGWFGPGAMVPEFETAVTTLEPGGVTDPFQTQFGWHVATLIELRTQPRPTLEDMTPQLTAQLQEEAVSARLEELAEDIVIEKPEAGKFDPNLIDQNELLE